MGERNGGDDEIGLGDIPDSMAGPKESGACEKPATKRSQLAWTVHSLNDCDKERLEN